MASVLLKIKLSDDTPDDDEEETEPVYLRIIKLESGTLIPLAGAVFEIYDPSGALIYTLATDESGEINVTVTEEGVYTVKEVTAPQYHILPVHTSQTVSVSAGGEAEVTVTFTNDPYGALTIEKRDEANGRGLSGASVQIKHIATGQTFTKTTDSAGMAVFDNLPVGGYEIREITAPEGYVLDVTVHTVAVKPLTEGMASYTLANSAKPGLTILKIDLETAVAIEGVTFEVWRDGTLFGSYVTDRNGEIELLDLEPGTYVVKETATVHPWVLDPTPQQTELTAGSGIHQLVFANAEKTGMYIVKLDALTLKPLAGARFRIERVGGGFIQELDCNADGEIEITHLEPGTYHVTELQPPPGYLSDPSYRVMEILPAKPDAMFVFLDYRRPTLELLKLDSKTGLPLADATFRIAKIEDGSRYLDRVTGLNGMITVSDLEPGVYSVQELAAPDGYVLNEEEYHVQLFPGRTSRIMVSDDHKPDLKIVKRDALTAVPLADATFKVRKADSSTYSTVTTDGKGEAWLYDLDPGVYEITETTAPPGYLQDAPAQLITLFPNRTGIAEFKNHLKPGLTILKVDEMTAQPLANAEFSIKHKDGSIIWEGLTDKNGQIHLTDLEDDWYTITEIAAPYGYLTANAPKDVKFAPGETVQVKFDNRLRPALKIIKVDEQTKKPLAGAKFKVWETEGGTTSEYITGDDGTITIYNLEETVYSVEEISAPQGYILETQHKDIELEWGKIKELVFTNKEKPALIILKVDAVTAAPLPNAEFSIKHKEGSVVWEGLTDARGEIRLHELDEDWYIITEVLPPDGYLADTAPKEVKFEPDKILQVKFDNTRKPTLIITKTDSTSGKRLTGALMKIELRNGNGGLDSLGTYRTNGNGQVIIPSVMPGDYIVTELQPPQGYSLPSNPVTEIHLSAGENAYLDIDTGGATGNENLAAFSATDGAEYIGQEVPNYPLNSIVLRKIDAVTGELLSGASFELRKVTEGISGGSGTIIGRWTTNHTGTVIITGLEHGGYIAEEVQAPANYTLSENAQQQCWLKADGTSIVELTFGNYPYPGLVIRKYDSITKEPLPNAEFLVKDSDGTVVGTSNGKFVTDANGIIQIPNVSAGSYIITEIKAPDGYLLDDTSQVIAVENNGKTYAVDFYNAPMSSAQIIKIDANTKQPLKGAEFTVYKANGEVIGTDKTDGNGIIILPELEPGWYKAAESKAPAGYVLDDTPQDFEVTSNEFIKLIFEDKALPGIQILKIDAETREPLRGAKYLITAADGRTIGEYTTDKQGLITLTNLKPDRYIATETAAPDEYILDPEPHSFEIVAGEKLLLTLENYAESGILIHKIDSVTGRGIYGVTFLISDRRDRPVGTYTTDQNGYIDVPELEDGKYYIREIEQASGYLSDTTTKTFYVEYGTTEHITWENTPVVGQIQITKKSADANPANGFPEDTVLSGAVFEVYTYAGNLADTIVTDANGYAATRPLPLGRYTIREVQAPANYAVLAEPISTEIQFANQIVRLEVLNKSLQLGATVKKRGYVQVVPGQEIKYEFARISNDGNAELESFYWRDTLPTDAVRLSRIYTGTWSANLRYKIVYRTNKVSEYRTLGDNLDTSAARMIDASPAALGFSADEYVTEVMFAFGTVPAGFSSKTMPLVYGKVLPGLAHEYQFTNKADVGGVQVETGYRQWTGGLRPYGRLQRENCRAQDTEFTAELNDYQQGANPPC
jgi:uncharacterized surface anchored protein